MTLDEYLIEHGMTIRAFKAKCPGVSYNTIKAVRRGLRLKFYDKAKAISDASGGAVSVSELCEEGVQVIE